VVVVVVAILAMVEVEWIIRVDETVRERRLVR